MEILNKLGLFFLILISGFFYRRFMDKYERDQEIRDLHIINQELLQKSKKPILWICVPKNTNARQWSSFYSRNSNDLNIPYMYFTIKSILNQCGKDFTVCMIDDDSFNALLPNWTPELNKIGDPLREKVRYLGMMQLLYHYGGIFVPPSFLCLRNLYPLYKTMSAPFVVENVNYNGSCQFAPDPYFIGANKECSVIKSYIDYLARMISDDYTAESLFLNDMSKWCALRCSNGDMTLVDAKMVGVKNKMGDAVVTEMFFEQQPLHLCDKKWGVLIPHEQILKRTALNWFCYIHKYELLTLDTELGSYFRKIE
jgi:hypothetical protein